MRLCAGWRRRWRSISHRSTRFRTSCVTARRRRDSACGCHGPTRTALAGCGTRSMRATFRTRTCVMRTCAPASCETSMTCCCTGTSISSWRNRFTACRKRGDRCLSGRRADPESWNTGVIRRHHGRHRLGRARRDSALRRERRTVRHTRQRIDAGARRRNRARSETRLGRRAAQRRAEADRCCASGRRSGDAHARIARARDIHSAGSSDCIRLSGAHACISTELPAIRRAATLAAHGVLHDLPRRPARYQQRRHAMGRSAERSAIPAQRPGVGRSPISSAARPYSMCPSGVAMSSHSTSIPCTAT